MRAADASLKATDESPPHLVDWNPHHAVSTATSASRITATSSCAALCWREGRADSSMIARLWHCRRTGFREDADRGSRLLSADLFGLGRESR